MTTAGVFRRALSALCFLAILLCHSLPTHAQTGSDPLLKAASRGDLSAVLESLNKGANVNAKDKDGWTPLLFASAKGHTKVAVGLLLAGANPNLALPDGTTPLMAAALRGDAVIVKVLLEKGADPAAKNKQGVTAKFIAESRGQGAAVAAISAAGVKSKYAKQFAGLVRTEFEQGLQFFKDQVAKNPADTEARAGLVVALLLKEDPEAAKFHYGRLKDSPGDSLYRALALAYYEGMVSSSPNALDMIQRTAEAGMEKGIVATIGYDVSLASGDYKMAKKFYNLAIEDCSKVGESDLNNLKVRYNFFLSVPGVYRILMNGKLSDAGWVILQDDDSIVVKNRMIFSSPGFVESIQANPRIGFRNVIIIASCSYVGPYSSTRDTREISLDLSAPNKGIRGRIKILSCTGAYCSPEGSVTIRELVKVDEPSIQHQFKTGCFIATAAFGSPFEAHVQTLRDFRDHYLLTNTFGSWFVTTYYRLSPPLADAIAERGWARAVTRCALAPIVVVAGAAMGNASDIALLLTALALCAVSVAAVVRRRRA